MTTFDERAAEWDANPVRRDMTLALADAIMARLALQGQETLLDYGAGTGILALKLRPRVGRVIAADSSRGMLDVLAAKVAGLGVPGIEPLLLDLEHDDAGPLRADVVVSTMALHHVKDTGGLARKLFALLNPGGQIAVADLETESGDFHDSMEGVHHRGFDRAALAAQFRDAGFHTVDTAIVYTVRKPRAGGVLKDYPILLLTGRRP